MTPVWMNRAEAAEWLRVSYDTVVRLEVPYQAERVAGRVRAMVIQIRGLNRMRVLTADVQAILAPPTGADVTPKPEGELMPC
jgi:uncharacterized protein with GYD domain